MLLLGISCASTAPRPRLVPGSSIAIPAAPGSFLLFSPTGVQLRQGTGFNAVDGPGPEAGLPMLAAIDLQQSMACVAYSRALCFVDLSRESITRSLPYALAGELRGCAIAGRRAALWSERQIIQLNEDGVTQSLELKALLRDSSADYIDYCLPIGEQGLLLIASKAQSAWYDGSSFALRLDRSSGTWMKKNQNEIQGLSSIHRVASQGSSIYVAGIFEKNQLSAGGGARLWQDALVFKIDLESLESTEVMRSPRQDRETIIRDLALGSDSISLLYHNGRVEVYKLIEGVRATTPSLERHFPGASSLAWVSENEILVMTGGTPESVRYE